MLTAITKLVVSDPTININFAVGTTRKYTDLQLAQGLERCRNTRELLLFLGLAPRGGNYETVRARIAELGLDGSHLRTFRWGRRLSDCSPDEIESAVSCSSSLAEVCRKLELKLGGNQSRLRTRIEALGIDKSHFKGGGWSRGAKLRPRKPIGEFLVTGRLVKTDRLKRRLILDGLKRSICERCLRGTWNSRGIPLELDHINGRRDDNRLENLRLLCPNCHAQTPTYRGRNIGAAQVLS
jgi:HNH endonuclease